jgi:hypothetical protein
MEANNMTAKRMILGVVGVTAGAWLFFAVPVMGHHAFTAEFDAARPIKVEGTLTRVDWVNPHSWLYLDVKKQDGSIEKWMFEGLGPSGLIRRGITRDHLKPGTELTIEGFLSKGTARRANGRKIIYASGPQAGTHIFVGSSGTGAPRDGNDPTEQ